MTIQLLVERQTFLPVFTMIIDSRNWNRQGSKIYLPGVMFKRIHWGESVLRSSKPVKKDKNEARRNSAGNLSVEDPFEHALAHTQKSETNSISKPASTDQNARAYYLRGLSHEKRGDFTRAIQCYDRALSLDPRLAWAYYHRGIAHGSAGNSRQQAEDLRAAARLGLLIAIDSCWRYVTDRVRKPRERRGVHELQRDTSQKITADALCLCLVPKGADLQGRYGKCLKCRCTKLQK